MKPKTSQFWKTFLFILALSLVFMLIPLHLAGTSVDWQRSTREIWSSRDISSETSQLQTLLVTYGRSGSSFTSNLIAHSEDVFYTFEPLSFLQIQKHRERIPTHLITTDADDFAYRVIESFLTCSFDNDTHNALVNYHLYMSNSTKTLASCLRKMEKGIFHLDCYFRFLEKCRSHNMTFAKTIRFSVDQAEPLMVRYPKLKLLYLVRDPRATLLSEAVVLNLFKLPRDAMSASNTHCKKLSRDLESLRRLDNLFPNRVKVIRYEDGAMRPHKYATDIYNFLGLTVTRELTDYVSALTTPKVSTLDGIETSGSGSPEKRKVNPYGTQRDDPLLAMQHWRYELGIEATRVIDGQCGHLYGQLGYRTVSTQRYLENTEEISLVVKPQSEGII